MAKSIKKWKKQGTKVILMPQAFGPFTSLKIRKAFKTVVENADLIFARDKFSSEYVLGLADKKSHVRIAPDFTTLIEGELPETFDSQKNRFCIIPNYRMIDKTSEQKGRKYILFLITCVKYLQEKNAKPFILIHDEDMDMCLAQHVAKETGQNIRIIYENHALRIKGIIGACDGVISSRFHGLVSALSQGIPALSTGWSHKYKMLFKDYGFPEGVLSVKAGPLEIQTKSIL